MTGFRNLAGFQKVSAGFLVAASLLLAAGCGDDGPATSRYAATYEVLQHTRNTSGCDSEGRTIEGERYFKLTDDGGSLGYHMCTSATECSEPVNQTKSFGRKDGDNWIGEIIEADPRRGACAVQYTKGELRPDGDKGVRIETHSYSGEVARDPSVDCDEQFVRDNVAALNCDQRDIVIAVPVE